MSLLRVLLLVFFTLTPTLALAYDVLLLQSMHDKGYDEAVRGFKRDCRGSVRRIVLSDYAELDLTRITREEHPKLIVAVGDRALELAQKQHATPVLYMLALNARPRGGAGGVSMLLDPGRYLSVFEEMGAERVGVLYDPARSGGYVKRAVAAAARGGVRLVLREVHAPKETPAMLASLKGKVDALWMLPDTTAVSPVSTEAYFLFSQAERVPVVTFADVYLSMGGAVALTIDRYDIGRQLAELAQHVLDGHTPEEGGEAPRRAVTRSNEGVVRQLKLNGLAGH
ncbi:ABC transporter substrate-binding protein [Geomonas sp. Red69]|uniref:ABC transporter substrate-binding protein n=1 Tax=Geomonas diazotrophica TaxID=2843197 RepID=A0ABX8JVX7_9BACT|nr:MULTISPECIES: ABC transporter substrate binding protein [Geomonas]MBU5637297.1 ABC transporter substrate-binding protein [Geomonas diazotrophica]QWV99585.1 ABC transporter substrate-binding protein [Geomonas nitrogeniifigens]QXE88759.1 ABC transporter substrate-binding protein [Geomonas nitrogeniifigens]